MRRATVIADDPGEVLRTSGDFIGRSFAVPIAMSLGKLLCEPKEAEKLLSEADIVIFKSIGTAVQDMYIAEAAMRCGSSMAQKVKL